MNTLENADSRVTCGYKEIEVCQESLLSKFAPEIIVNGIAYNLKYERPLVRQWHSNGSAIEEMTEIQIQFPKLVMVKFLYTAWTIESLDYSFYSDKKISYMNEMNDSQIWNFNKTSDLPTNIPLHLPIIGRNFFIKLEKHDTQKSPYIELRGCIIENNYNSDDDDFAYHVENGVRYESPKLSLNVNNFQEASKFCAKKNGTLAMADSPSKTEALRQTIKKHLQKYHYQNPSYLIGKCLHLFVTFFIEMCILVERGS